MEFSDITKDKPDEIIHLMNRLREFIMDSDLDLEESFAGGAKVKMVYYYLQKNTKVVSLLQPADDHVKILLHHFDKLDLEKIKLQGSGKHARHFRISSWNELLMEEYKKSLIKISEIRTKELDLL